MIRTTVLRGPAGAELHLAGGVLGLAEDGPQVERLLESQEFDAVFLGVPFEDLDAIRATNGQESGREFERDEMDEVYLKTLARFGRTQVPPPDLYAAYDHAHRKKVRIEAVDLGDEGHSSTYAENVGVFEIIRNNRRLKGLGPDAFSATDPEAFAREWDERLFPTKGLRKVQAAREGWMAKRIQELIPGARRAFALVPLARWAGVRNRLLDAGFRADL